MWFKGDVKLNFEDEEEKMFEPLSIFKFVDSFDNTILGGNLTGHNL